tara:strand:+ start:133 stop:432 length:300 start_codon:yes stop_codon:yes gene_type:complete
MNGYRNWNHYNVAVWMHNDRELYRVMISTVQDSGTLEQAIVKVYNQLKGQKTQDGVPFTLAAIREAMEGQELEEFLDVAEQASLFNMETSELQDFISGS